MELRTDFRYWAQEWLAHGRPEISEQRLRADEARVRKYVSPTFGKRSVTRIRDHQVREWLDALEAEGVGKATLHASLICLRGICQYAIDKGLAIPDGNPAAKVSVENMPAIHSPTMDEIPTERQIQSIVRHIDPWYAPLVLFAARTGAKWEECLGLRTGDLYFNQRRVTIGRLRAAEGEGGIAYVEGTGLEVRLVEIPDDVCDSMRLFLEETKEFRDKEFDFIFLTKRSHTHPFRPNFNTLVWRPALEEIGLEGTFTFHDLRHAAAARMILEEGMSLEDVSRALGHLSPQTTKRIYKNFFLERDKRERRGKAS